MKTHTLVVLAFIVIVAGCSNAANSVPSAAGAPAYPPAVSADMLSVHPPRVHFASPSAPYKVVHVRGFGENGAISENCIAKGVAEVAGDGLHGKTLIADVIPMASGRCEATFTDGRGAHVKLHVIVGP